MEEGRSFSAAAAVLGLEVVTTETFNAYGSLGTEFENADAIVPAIMRLPQNGLSDIVPTAEGALLVHVITRRPGDAVTMQFLRPQLQSTLDRYRAQTVYESWLDYLLRHFAFEDLNPPVEPADESGA
jgi:hypothetical protein